jgi:AhpD family alkylhydroperoxidase
MSKFIKYDLNVTPSDNRDGRTGAIYEQIHDTLELVPEPFTIHSPNPDVLAGAWSIFRETLYSGHIEHGIKQGLATVVSKLNECPWCVDAHSMMLHASGRREILQSIRDDKSLNDDAIQAQMEWAAASLTPDAGILRNPPFESKDAPEMIGTVLTFHYLNRVVNVLLEETPISTSTPFREGVKRIMAFVYRRMTGGKVHNVTDAGGSLQFLPDVDAPMPDVFKWAEPSNNVAAAFTALESIMTQVEDKYVPLEVQAVIEKRLKDWQGENMGIGKAWVEEDIAGLADEHKPIGRLVLLSALGSNQVTGRDIESFRELGNDDEALVGVVAWGAYCAMHRISQWLY